MCDERKFYNELLTRKANGEYLDFDIITSDEMYTLWAKESVSDKEIAKLYDVPVSRVNTRRRNKFNITQYSVVNDKLFPSVKNDEDNLRNNTKEIVLTDSVEEIITAINRLSNEDSIILIDYLINNNRYIMTHYYTRKLF